MDAPYYNGSDTRDTLDPDLEERCPDCGVTADEKCEPECRCTYCERQRAREDARQRSILFELEMVE